MRIPKQPAERIEPTLSKNLAISVEVSTVGVASSSSDSEKKLPTNRLTVDFLWFEEEDDGELPVSTSSSSGNGPVSTSEIQSKSRTNTQLLLTSSLVRSRIFEVFSKKKTTIMIFGLDWPSRRKNCAGRCEGNGGADGGHGRARLNSLRLRSSPRTPFNPHLAHVSPPRLPCRTDFSRTARGEGGRGRQPTAARQRSVPRCRGKRRSAAPAKNAINFEAQDGDPLGSGLDVWIPEENDAGSPRVDCFQTLTRKCQRQRCRCSWARLWPLLRIKKRSVRMSWASARS